MGRAKLKQRSIAYPAEPEGNETETMTTMDDSQPTSVCTYSAIEFLEIVRMRRLSYTLYVYNCVYRCMVRVCIGLYNKGLYTALKSTNRPHYGLMVRPVQELIEHCSIGFPARMREEIEWVEEGIRSRWAKIKDGGAPRRSQAAGKHSHSMPGKRNGGRSENRNWNSMYWNRKETKS